MKSASSAWANTSFCAISSIHFHQGPHRAESSIAKRFLQCFLARTSVKYPGRTFEGRVNFIYPRHGVFFFRAQPFLANSRRLTTTRQPCSFLSGLSLALPVPWKCLELLFIFSRLLRSVPCGKVRTAGNSNAAMQCLLGASSLKTLRAPVWRMNCEQIRELKRLSPHDDLQGLSFHRRGRKRAT